MNLFSLWNNYVGTFYLQMYKLLNESGKLTVLSNTYGNKSKIDLVFINWELRIFLKGVAAKHIV